jgi:hypothetical protein
MKELAQKFFDYVMSKSFMFDNIKDFKDNACKTIKLKRFTTFCNDENLDTKTINDLSNYLVMINFFEKPIDI